MLMGKLEEFKEERAVLYKRVSELDKSIETLETRSGYLKKEKIFGL
nr:MAG TPA: hypothetical protein [Caudoviricetes sp.]